MKGIDVSSHNTVNWDAAKEAGLESALWLRKRSGGSR